MMRLTYIYILCIVTFILRNDTNKPELTCVMDMWNKKLKNIGNIKIHSLTVIQSKF